MFHQNIKKEFLYLQYLQYPFQLSFVLLEIPKYYHTSIQKMQMDVKFSTRSIHGRVWDVNTCIQKTVQQKESNADYLCKNA